MTDKNAEQFKAEGNRYFTKEDFVRALIKYTEAISQDRKNPVLFSNRAATLLKLKRWDIAIEDCNNGLELSLGNEKLKPVVIKLLWRKAIGLKELNSLHEALRIVNQGLRIDPNNSTLKSEYESITSLLDDKSEEMVVDHEPVQITKTTKGEPNKEVKNTSKIITVPIQIVNKIPEDFFGISTEPSNTILSESVVSNNKIKQEQVTLSEEIQQPQSVTKKFPQKTFDDENNYPTNPTIQFLLSLKEKSNHVMNSYYEYILTIDPKHYQKIFKTTGIEPEFLDFFLQSCIYVLENDLLGYKDQIINLLNVFTKLPRFTLTSMFSNDKYIESLKHLFRVKLKENFNDYWK